MLSTTEMSSECSKLKHFDVISMIDNSIQTMENCCRFVNFGKTGRLEMVLD